MVALVSLGASASGVLVAAMTASFPLDEIGHHPATDQQRTLRAVQPSWLAPAGTGNEKET